MSLHEALIGALTYSLAGVQTSVVHVCTRLRLGRFTEDGVSRVESLGLLLDVLTCR